jgi:hypothetical protein
VRVSLPLFGPPGFPAALGFPLSAKGGGAPGWRRVPDVSDVVVDDRTTVKLVDSCRVVDVVLLLVVFTVVVVVDVLTAAVVDGPAVMVLVADATTTTPVIPCEAWILQW